MHLYHKLIVVKFFSKCQRKNFRSLSRKILTHKMLINLLVRTSLRKSGAVLLVTFHFRLTDYPYFWVSFEGKIFEYRAPLLKCAQNKSSVSARRIHALLYMTLLMCPEQIICICETDTCIVVYDTIIVRQIHINLINPK